MTEADRAHRLRRSFGPVVLLGLGASALGAVACAKPWMGSSLGNSLGHGAAGSGGSMGQDASLSGIEEGVRYPLASAVSLVLLAAWGVLLVTRGRVRRGFALVAAVAAVALVVTVVTGHATLPHSGGTGSLDTALGRHVDRGFTGWFWTAAVAAVVAVVPGVLAVRLAPHWPEMGSRYDAPTETPVTPEEPDSEREIWRALDEGRDPTDQ